MVGATDEAEQTVTISSKLYTLLRFLFIYFAIIYLFDFIASLLRGRTGNKKNRRGRQPASVGSQHATANTSEDWGHTVSTMEQLRPKIAKLETTLLIG